MVVSDGRQHLQYSRWCMPVGAYQECRHVMCSFACGTCRLVPEFMFWVTDFRRKYQHRKHTTNSDSHELPMRYDMGCSRGWYIVRPLGPFYKHGLTLIPAWISNHMHRRGWDGLTYLFLTFNGCTTEVWEWINNFIPHIIIDVITYPCWD